MPTCTRCRRASRIKVQGGAGYPNHLDKGDVLAKRSLAPGADLGLLQGVRVRDAVHHAVDPMKSALFDMVGCANDDHTWRIHSVSDEDQHQIDDLHLCGPGSSYDRGPFLSGWGLSSSPRRRPNQVGTTIDAYHVKCAGKKAAVTANRGGE